MRKKILFFSNLYPLPWQKTRAQYNYQQTSCMEEYADISYLIPVPFFTWIKQVLFKNNNYKESNYCLFPFFYLPKIGRSLHPFFMLLSIVVSIKPLFWFASHQHVLASWAYPEGVVAAILKKVFRFTLTIDCLGTDINVHGNSTARKKQLDFAFKTADTITTKSNDLAHKVATITSKANIQTIYNGVNCDLFTLTDVTDSEKTDLLFIGNIIKTKGIFELLESARILMLEKFNFTLTIIGSGEEIDKVKSYVLEHNLGNTITILGAVDHSSLSTWLSKSTALILPSYREGVPNVIMEALASGIPVVATKVGGIPEVVFDDFNGFLIDSYQVKDIVFGVKRLSGKKWNKLEIRDSVSSYTWDNTAEQFLKTFA